MPKGIFFISLFDNWMLTKIYTPKKLIFQARKRPLKAGIAKPSTKQTPQHKTLPLSPEIRNVHRKAVPKHKKAFFPHQVY